MQGVELHKAVMMRVCVCVCGAHHYTSLFPVPVPTLTLTQQPSALFIPVEVQPLLSLREVHTLQLKDLFS